MTKILTDIGISVFVGVLTFFLSVLVKSTFLPMLVSYFRDDMDVSGKWTWYENSNPEPIGNLTISQRGGSLKGQLVRESAKSGQSKRRVYRVTGGIYHSLILLEFQEDGDPRRRGTISLTVSQTKEIAYGLNAFIEIDTNKPISDLYLFFQEGYTEIDPKTAFDKINALIKAEPEGDQLLIES